MIAAAVLAGCSSAGPPPVAAPIASGESVSPFADSALGGPIDAPTPTPPPVTVIGKWGQPSPVEIADGVKGTVTVEEPKQYEIDGGKMRLVYRITGHAEPANTAVWRLFSHHFYMNTGEGDRYEGNVGSDYAPMFGGDDLRPDEKTRGYLYFDVPTEGRYRMGYESDRSVVEWGAAS